MRFEGKVLLATGGASGLGAAVGRRFAAEGGRVAVADRDQDRAQAVAGELDGAIALAVDVADQDAVSRCVQMVAQHFGSVDCLFNCRPRRASSPGRCWPWTAGKPPEPSGLRSIDQILKSV